MKFPPAERNYLCHSDDRHIFIWLNIFLQNYSSKCYTNDCTFCRVSFLLSVNSFLFLNAIQFCVIQLNAVASLLDIISSNASFMFFKPFFSAPNLFVQFHLFQIKILLCLSKIKPSAKARFVFTKLLQFFAIFSATFIDIQPYLTYTTLPNLT